MQKFDVRFQKELDRTLKMLPPNAEYVLVVLDNPPTASSNVISSTLDRAVLDEAASLIKQHGR